MNNDDAGQTKISSLFNSEVPGKAMGSTANLEAAGPDAGTHQMGTGDSMPGNNVSQIGGQGSDAMNPFTSELKSDMTSQLSMDMSTFSQFFKNSGEGSQMKKVALLGALIAIAVGAVVMFNPFASSPTDDAQDIAVVEDDETDEDSSSDYDDDYESDADDLASDSDEEEFDADAGGSDYGEDSSGEDEYSDDGLSSDEGLAASGGEGAPQITSPLDGQARNYDETSADALFEWSGEPGGTIYFSRNAQMDPIERKASVAGNSFKLAHPWPGTWYWRVENAQGQSAVSSFVVDAPVRRQVVLGALPQPLSGSGGTISWQGDGKVARYKVELSQSGWSNPQFRLQTSGTTVTLSNVMAGTYKLRVGAFSEVAGRWEYTQPQDITIE